MDTHNPTKEQEKVMQEELIQRQMSVLDEIIDKYADGALAKMEGADPDKYELLLRRAVIALHDSEPDVEHPRSDGAPRMTTAQMLALWGKCGGYNVRFREDDYVIVRSHGQITPGYVEGWIGGSLHAAGNPHSTIYVGVSPDGRINS